MQSRNHRGGNIILEGKFLAFGRGMREWLHSMNRSNTHKQDFGLIRGKKLLGRPRRRWENNFKTDIRETVCEGL
jgi:hypothetical protein